MKTNGLHRIKYIDNNLPHDRVFNVLEGEGAKIKAAIPGTKKRVSIMKKDVELIESV